MAPFLVETERYIPLPTMNDIRTCGELKNRLAECLGNKCVLLLDAEYFQSGDITFVQILASAVKTAEKMGARLEVANANPAFTALLERCGLDADALGLRSREQ